MHRSFVALFALSALSACVGSVAPTNGQLDPDGPDPEAIDACVALATTFRDHCAASNGSTDERVHLWNGYVALCRTGNTDLLLASMQCMDSTQCRAFSDANEGNACLDALHASMQPAPISHWLEGFCSRCGSPDCPVGRAEIIPYLPASEEPSLATCSASAACTIDGVVAACGASVPQLTPFATP